MLKRSIMSLGGIYMLSYAKYHIKHINSPGYGLKSHSAVERVIKSVEEGFCVELIVGSPPREAIHVMS